MDKKCNEATVDYLVQSNIPPREQRLYKYCFSCFLPTGETWTTETKNMKGNVDSGDNG